ncbi:MAG: TlpA family protein disulfide reductase [Bacteroidaceae bacterium]|nr:TlpA family protein disulfide reductase [Bacteroidaceae bacterium]
MKKAAILLMLSLSLNLNAQTTSNFADALIEDVNQRMEACKAKQNELMTLVRGKEMTPELRAQGDSIYRIYMTMYEAINDDIKSSIESHLNDAATSKLLLTFKRQLGYDYIETIMPKYAFSNTDELAGLRNELAIEATKKPGAQLVDFELPDDAGINHRLSEYVGKGHFVLVDFWASWCGPCRAEMPNVLKAYERFHDKGFDILGLSFDSNRDAWLKAVAELGMTWPQLSDLQGWKSLAAQKYGVHAIPFTMLFDPSGKVVATNLRGDALSAKLEELMIPGEK